MGIEWDLPTANQKREYGISYIFMRCGAPDLIIWGRPQSPQGLARFDGWIIVNPRKISCSSHTKSSSFSAWVCLENTVSTIFQWIIMNYHEWSWIIILLSWILHPHFLYSHVYLGPGPSGFKTEKSSEEATRLWYETGRIIGEFRNSWYSWLMANGCVCFFYSRLKMTKASFFEFSKYQIARPRVGPEANL